MDHSPHSPLFSHGAPLISQGARRIRIDTLSRLRWLAIGGQLAAVLLTSFILKFQFPVALCLGVIGLSVLLNLAIRFKFSKAHRLDDRQAALLLAFDILQLTGLLYLTGGLENPFAILFLAPVTIAAVSTPRRELALLFGLMAICATIVGLRHLPLPGFEAEIVALPWLYRLSFWAAILVSCLFIAVYASRVSDEARALGQALAATELVLERENHLSQLDGLAAAAAHELGTPLATIALIGRELSKTTLYPELEEDFGLLWQEAQRCRTILSKLTSLAEVSAEPFGRTSLGVALERIVEPLRRPAVEVRILTPDDKNAPVVRHNPGFDYGMTNFIENAIDFANSTVVIRAQWSDQTVEISILDDGPGFPPDVLDHIGDPYVTTRENRRIKSEESSGLGLGVFIAKTLLERSGAKLFVSNREIGGASIHLKWDRQRFELRDA